MHEWADLDPRELPDPALLAGHAVPATLNSPDIIHPVMEDLANSVGKGEQRPNNNNISPFVSAYRRVFDAHRGVFGSGGGGSGPSPSNSPRFERRPLAVTQIKRDMDASNKQLDKVGFGGGFSADPPVRPSRAGPGPPLKTTVKSGLIGQTFKVSPAAAGFIQPAVAKNAPSVMAAIATNDSSKGDESKRHQPVILPRLATDKFREPLKKVSLDLKGAPVNHKSTPAAQQLLTPQQLSAPQQLSTPHQLSAPQQLSTLQQLSTTQQLSTPLQLSTPQQLSTLQQLSAAPQQLSTPRQPYRPPSQAGELLRTPSGLPDLIPDQRPSAAAVDSHLSALEPDIGRGTTTAQNEAVPWMRPTDVLRTPYLIEPARSLETSCGPLTPAGRPLTVASLSEMAAPRFPQIAGNSVVAKGSLEKGWPGNITRMCNYLKG